MARARRGPPAASARAPRAARLSSCSERSASPVTTPSTVAPAERHPGRRTRRPRVRPRIVERTAQRARRRQRLDLRHGVGLLDVGRGALRRMQDRARRYARRVDLHPGEQVIYDGHPSWRSVMSLYARGALVGLALGAIAGSPSRTRPACSCSSAASCSRSWSASCAASSSASRSPTSACGSSAGSSRARFSRRGSTRPERQHAAVAGRPAAQGREGRLRHRRHRRLGLRFDGVNDPHEVVAAIDQRAARADRSAARGHRRAPADRPLRRALRRPASWPSCWPSSERRPVEHVARAELDDLGPRVGTLRVPGRDVVRLAGLDDLLAAVERRT